MIIGAYPLNNKNIIHICGLTVYARVVIIVTSARAVLQTQTNTKVNFINKVGSENSAVALHL